MMRLSTRASRSKRRAKLSPSASFPIVCSRLAFQDRTRLNFALELDRGTMDIKSRQLVGKSSFRRKLLGYYQLWKEGLHTSQWGFKAFRVLTVTPSEKRIENMIAVQKEIVGEQGSNLFLFTTPNRLAEKSPFADVWVTGKGAPDGPPIMTALACTYHSSDRVAGSSFAWPDFGAGPALSRARFALPRRCFRSASLDSASYARATFTAMQMRSFARFDKV